MENRICSNVKVLKIEQDTHGGRFDYTPKQLLSFINELAYEYSNYGTSDLDKEDIYDATEYLIDGDKFLLDAIKKYDKSIKDKKGAREWLTNKVMSSGDPLKQK